MRPLATGTLGLCLALSVITACLAGPTLSPGSEKLAQATMAPPGAHEVTLTQGRSHWLYVLASLGSQAGPFRIDPWAPISLLTPDAVTRLNQRLKDGMVKSPPISLGGVTLPVDLMTVDSHVTEMAERADGIRPLGLIGQDLLATTVVEFDLSQHVLRLGTALGAETAGDDILTFAGKDTRLPIIEVRIHDTNLRLLLDPTTEGVLLAYDSARQAGMVASATMDLTMNWQDLAATMPVFGETLGVGPITRQGQMVHVLPPHTAMPATPDPAASGYDGLLGIGTITTHRVIIDYPRQRVVLRPR